MTSVTPNDAIARLRTTYASAAAYRDRGRAFVTDEEGDGASGPSGVFSTTFMRTRGLHYEFQADAGDPIVIHAAFGTAVELRGLDFRVDSLDSAVSYATGVTVRSARTVPALLLPNLISGATIRGSGDRVDRADVNGVLCLAIRLVDGGELLVREHDCALLRLCRPLPPITDADRERLMNMGIELGALSERSPTAKRVYHITYEPEIYAQEPEGFAFQ
jgi:hypothetical protein